MSTAYPPARIQFEHYQVRRAVFTLSEGYADAPDTIELDYRLKHRISTSEDRQHSKVDLTCDVFPGNGPFKLRVELQGFFRVDNPDEDIEQLKRLLSTNTIAILYPYLRATVTSLTAAANVSPVVLPTINVAAMMKQKGTKRATKPSRS